MITKPFKSEHIARYFCKSKLNDNSLENNNEPTHNEMMSKYIGIKTMICEKLMVLDGIGGSWTTLHL